METLLRRIWYVLRHRRFDDELAEEMEFHRAMTQETLEHGGTPHDQAASASRRVLGNDLSARNRARDVWVWPWLQDISQDVRFAARLLIKDPWFSVTAILALGIGAGVNGTMFAIFNAYCLAGLPIERPDRVVYIATRDLQTQERGISYAELDDLRRSGLTSVTGIAAFTGGSVSVGDEERAPDRFFRAYISANAFPLIGAKPMLGRDFQLEDDRPGAPGTVILASHVWRSRYAADPAILGRTITLNRVPAVVIGVMPDDFKFPNRADVWQPLELMSELKTQPRDARILGAYARLVDGMSQAQTQVELTTASARFTEVYPSTNKAIRFTAQTINDRYNSQLHPAWAAFVTAGALILLIACANVANLLLSRSIARFREIAIRASLGATRQRVVRQLLVESALLALLGSVVGLVIARVSLILFTKAIPEVGVPYAGFVLDRLVLVVFAAASFVTVFVFGLAPAVTVARTDVNRVLKDGGRGTRGPGAQRWTAVFLTVELAVTVLLLIQLGESSRRNAELRKVDELIDPRPLMTAWLTLPAERYATPASRVAFHKRLVEQLESVGEIASIELASALPLGGAQPQQIQIEGYRGSDDAVLPAVRTLTIGPRYFETLQLPVLRGRAFAERDGGAGHETAIVNQRFTELLFPDQEALGQRFRLRRDASAEFSAWLTIVGVVPTIRQRTSPELDPIAYVPFRSSAPATAVLMARTAGDPAVLASRLREEVRALDSDLPLYRVMTMTGAMADAGWNAQVSASFLTVLTAIALGLASIGLYAVTAHAVSQRTSEIGVRMALGARSAQVSRLVLLRAARQGALGLIIGALGAIAWGRLFFFEGAGRPYRPPDTVVILGVAAVVAAVVLLASLVPVRRATRVDPVTALRHQ